MKVDATTFHAACKALERITGQSVPALVAYRLRKQMKAVEGEYEPLEEQRREILMEHAATNGDGQPKTTSDGRVLFEDMAAAQEELSEYMEGVGEVEVDVDAVPLEKIESVEVSTAELDALIEAGFVGP